MSRGWSYRPFLRPYSYIQWKGTNVCMDCYCLCGKQFHIDADFAYAVKCPHCGQVYEMSANIEMRALAPNEEWDGCEPREDDFPYDKD